MLQRAAGRTLLVLAAWCIVAMLAARSAAAQGGNVDIISGSVMDQAGKPVPNAVVEALSIETDVTRRTTTVPQDAVRTTRVVTNTSDVARGGFAGGQVNVTSKGGSNRVSGSLSGQYQDRNLAFGGNTGNVFGSGNTNEQLGGSGI